MKDTQTELDSQFNAAMERKKKVEAEKRKRLKQAEFKRKVQSVKNFFSQLVNTPVVFLFLASLLNISSILFSVWLVFTIYTLVMTEAFLIAGGLVILLLIVNTYVFSFNKFFKISLD